jgi:hypothetical protein
MHQVGATRIEEEEEDHRKHDISGPMTNWLTLRKKSCETVNRVCVCVWSNAQFSMVKASGRTCI